MDQLIVQSIAKNFSGIQALKDISLKIDKQEILGLIGPNGSGKTTLVNIISGFIAPDLGKITIKDIDITGWEPYRIARQGISRTFQTGHLFQALTTRENIEISVEQVYNGNIDNKVEQLMERLDLSQWADKTSGSLPYGIQRRLEIARGLGSEPLFLLLDEPAAGLNEQESIELMQVIKDIHIDEKIGCGILIIDHDLHMILKLCDRVQVLNEGKTIADGPPQEIRNHPEVIQAYMGKRQAKEYEIH